MKPRSLLLLVLAGCLLPLWHVTAMTDKEMLAVINKVTQRMNRGDVKALDDLKTIPSDTAVPALLMFYRQNHVVMRETPENRVIASRSAQLVAEVPGADVYLKGLFKKQTTENLPGWFERQREAAVDAMVQVHNKFAIRVLADALTAPDRGMDAARLGAALADMNIPSAPYSKETRKSAGSPDGIAKWKEWWEANKAQYAQ